MTALFPQGILDLSERMQTDTFLNLRFGLYFSKRSTMPGLAVGQAFRLYEDLPNLPIVLTSLGQSL